MGLDNLGITSFCVHHMCILTCQFLCPFHLAYLQLMRYQPLTKFFFNLIAAPPLQISDLHFVVFQRASGLKIVFGLVPKQIYHVPSKLFIRKPSYLTPMSIISSFSPNLTKSWEGVSEAKYHGTNVRPILLQLVNRRHEISHCAFRLRSCKSSH